MSNANGIWLKRWKHFAAAPLIWWKPPNSPVSLVISRIVSQHLGAVFLQSQFLLTNPYLDQALEPDRKKQASDPVWRALQGRGGKRGYKQKLKHISVGGWVRVTIQTVILGLYKPDSTSRRAGVSLSTLTYCKEQELGQLNRYLQNLQWRWCNTVAAGSG